MGDVEHHEEYDAEVHGAKRTLRFPKLYWRSLITILVPLIFLPIIIQNDTTMFRCLYVICVMAIYWITECLPAQITALLPIFMFPFMGIMPTDKVSMQYMKASNFLFIGGIILADAIEYSLLHSRVAFFAVTKVGCGLRKLNCVLMVITMLVSMWIPNTAACAMMCPIAKAILTELEALGRLKMFHPPTEEHKPARPTDVTMCFYFGLAYAATIGGCATLIGTPTNLAFKQLYESRFENAPPVRFLTFMLFSAPITVIATLLTFVWLNFIYLGLFRPGSPGADLCEITDEVKLSVNEAIKSKYNELGKVTSHEKWVGFIFVATIVGICSKSPGFADGWSFFFNSPIGETTVCILGVFFLFVIPSKWTCFRFCKKDEPVPKKVSKTLVLWSIVHNRTPWALLFLLGGGFALAEGAKVSGVSEWLEVKLTGVRVLPNMLVIFLIGISVEFLTNFTANVAVANIVLPVAPELAIAIHVHPMYLMLPAAISCSFAFCLPVGTPPNAIVTGLIHCKTSQMILCGLGPSLICLILYIVAYPTYGALVFPEYQSFPDWAKNTTAG